MPKVTKGHAACPECTEIQPVQYDGKKYFISCSHCRTFTSYQANVAKARIQQRLTPVEDVPAEPTPQPERVEGTPAIKTNTQPYKPVNAKGFFESLAEYL